MKKNSFAVITASVTLLMLGGCQQLQDQATKLQTDVDQKIQGTSKQVEGMKKNIMDTKAQVDQKVKDVNDAGVAIQKAIN